MSDPRDPVDLSHVPAGEDVEPGQAAEEVERDPEAQRNATDPAQDDTPDHPG